MPDRTVKFNDLTRLYERVQADVEPAVLAVLRSGWWLNGGAAAHFAAAFADLIGVDHCIPVANGTDALEIALRAVAAGAEPGRDEVVMVANAGGYAAVAARNAGLVPVHCDVEEESQLLSEASLVSCLGPRTLAVVATHLYGGLVDVPALKEAMKAAGHPRVTVVEDCAQAHGARLGGAAAGALGDIAAFSFYPTKNLGAMGDAGAVTTRSGPLARRVRALAQYGWVGRKYMAELAGGRNSRMDEVQAAVLSALLPRLDAFNAERAAILARYEAAAPAGVVLPRRRPGSVVHLAVVLAERREALAAHLARSGVMTEIHYPVPDCDQPGWSALPGRVAPDGLAVSRRSAQRILSLPCFVGMTEDEVARVSRSLADFGAP